MKKSKKVLLRMIPVLFACLALISVLGGTGVLATNVSSDLPDGSPTGPLTSVSNVTGTVWSTVTLIAQVCAFAAIIIAGIRYMFASADTKADIKTQTITLVVGAVLVFGASLVVQLLTGILGEFETTL